MEATSDLIYLKKMFMNTRMNYQNPHMEAMTLKKLWTYNKSLHYLRGIDVIKIVKEATRLVKNPDNPPGETLALIKKGLHADPRSHQLYALRGQIYAQQGDWKRAIHWYETARRMLKFEKCSNVETLTKYHEILRNVYLQRGQWHEKNLRLIEAAADYEQVLVLSPKHTQIFDTQDMLLKCLRKMEKYEAYRAAWLTFTSGTNPQRTADLMTQHAEFKIHIREVAVARRMLREAISLDHGNMNAKDMLQVIVDTGHTMLTYAIIWCINGCYDKALVTIDKGTDCNPYNPGFTVLKTIVLRMSGRLTEAMTWLENVNKTFYKMLEPPGNKRGSIMGNLTVEETEAMLINQWHLIRYDMAMEHIINGKYNAALKLLQNEKLPQNQSADFPLLLGDCFIRQGRMTSGLEAYLKAHEKSITTDCWQPLDKRPIVAQRITEIMNSQALPALQRKQTRKARTAAEGTLKILEEIPLTKLGSQRSEALMYAERSRYQASPIRPTINCVRGLAESLSFGRAADDGGLRNFLLGDNANLEKLITCHASKKKFPYCTQILMQK